MEPRLKWSKIILAGKIILFHLRRDVWNEIKIILATKIISDVVLCSTKIL